ncbi:MAG: ATP-binding protein [Nodosilinea sp.]
MTPNPFIPKALISRHRELAEISQILAADGDFLLVGVPGMGRRLLLQEAAHQANARLLAIDCLRTTSAGSFLTSLATSLSLSFTSPEDLALIRRWAPGHPLELLEEADHTWHLRWTPSSAREWPLFEALLALPQYLAEKLDCRVVLVFQNFPHIRSWDRQGKWEAYLRQEIQRQSQVSYALVATVVEPWVIASGLRVIHLLPLTDGDMEPWLTAAMAAEGLRFDPQDHALDRFLGYVQGHLGDAMSLARRIWLDRQSSDPPPTLIRAWQVDSSLAVLMEDLTVTFESLLLLLPPSQVRVLESLALDPTDSPQSRQYIKKHQLSRGGGLQGALNSLEQKGLIYGPEFGYRIALPLLGLWLRKQLT